MKAEEKHLRFQVGPISGLEQPEFGNVHLLTPRCNMAIIRDNTTASDKIDSQY